MHTGFIRAQLICDVLHVVQDRRLAAADVSRILDVPAERVSALLHRDHIEFTIDDLVRMIARAGVELRMTKSSPVDEESFDGPLCRASGSGLHEAVRSRLVAMAARLNLLPLAALDATDGEAPTIEELIEKLGDAGVRLTFSTPW